MITEAFVEQTIAVVDGVSDDDFELAQKCMQRAASIYPIDDRVGLLLDILATHNRYNLDLAELLQASECHFGHDIIGIHNHFDRTTRTMKDSFCPRFAIHQI